MYFKRITPASHQKSGPARGFGYTVSWAFLFQVYGIFGQNSGIKYLVFPEF